jgi:hypothetical protein
MRSAAIDWPIRRIARESDFIEVRSRKGRRETRVELTTGVSPRIVGAGGLYGFTLDQSGFEERIDTSFVELDASRNFYKSSAATSGARVSADG